MQRVFVRALTLIGRRPAGDVFEVNEREAKMLVYTRRAELVQNQAKQTGMAPQAPKRRQLPAEPPPPPPPPPEEPPVEPPTGRQDYHHTDVTETESPGVEELRSQYRRRFGQEPDGRWGVPRLTQELGG